MRQAITTTYRGPTDRTGSRIIAKCDAKRITVPWDHALDAPANHAAAALTLASKLGWGNGWLGGSVGSGSYVFVDASTETVLSIVRAR